MFSTGFDVLTTNISPLDPMFHNAQEWIEIMSFVRKKQSYNLHNRKLHNKSLPQRLIATESFQSKVDGKRTRKMAFLEISIRQACLIHRQSHLIVGALLDPRRLISLPYSVKAPYSVALFH